MESERVFFVAQVFFLKKISLGFFVSAFHGGHNRWCINTIPVYCYDIEYTLAVRFIAPFIKIDRLEAHLFGLKSGKCLGLLSTATFWRFPLNRPSSVFGLASVSWDWLRLRLLVKRGTYRIQKKGAILATWEDGTVEYFEGTSLSDA